MFFLGPEMHTNFARRNFAGETDTESYSPFCLDADLLWGDQIVWRHELARGCKPASISDLAVSVDTHVSLVTLVIWLKGEV